MIDRTVSAAGLAFDRDDGLVQHVPQDGRWYQVAGAVSGGDRGLEVRAVVGGEAGVEPGCHAGNQTVIRDPAGRRRVRW